MSPRLHAWTALAVVVVAAGAVSSALAASTLARTDGARAHQAFLSSSAEISATLRLAINQEKDLALSAGAFIVGDPDATQRQFVEWTRAIRAFKRNAELQYITELAYVPASQLRAFARRDESDPPGPLSAGRTFKVVPPGARPYYCFTAVLETRHPVDVTPAGVDYCAGAYGPELLAARDSGHATYVPDSTGKGAPATLAIGASLYRGGVLPKTVAQRRAAFLGWTAIDILPSVILDAALQGHPRTAVAFRYTDGSSTVTLRAGSTPQGAQAATMNLHNGWTVETFSVVSGSGVLENTDARSVLFGGVILSLLLGLLLHVLGIGRRRATLLVERSEQLRHQALHDSLTGLANRALILDRIDHVLSLARRHHTPVAALFLDIDDFKDVNDALGHIAGDQLLAAVGERLANSLRDEDTIGRLGGDEFVVLLEGASLSAGAEKVAERVLEVLRVPFVIEASEVPLDVSVSIGVATGNRDTPEELLRDADIALYNAKAAGKRRAVLFSPSMQDAVDDHHNLELDLRRAIEDEQLYLVYQPTVDLVTGALNGVEALLRWLHPLRGVVQPDDFIPTLESTGLIVRVGTWVLETACRQGATWQSEGYRFSISVNIAAAQLERDEISDDVRGALEASGFDPSLLILELTETTLMRNLESTVNRLAVLKSIGVRLAIDDFGTGYSSIAYLRQLPIDVLKIDRIFVSEVADTAAAATLVHTLVQLGKNLGLETIAEGIENEDQRVRLTAEHVDSGQGFLFARPLDVSDMDDLLRRPTIGSSAMLAPS